ncbi:MAG: alpha/beta hydrolase [Candidatus Omnitrophica bacterium]|nr:Haloalkane dehalogenase 2 [bacterium]NUN96646.1 alpha/beta hydrolase [Candidatus Omnitrophota bacterium]
MRPLGRILSALLAVVLLGCVEAPYTRSELRAMRRYESLPPDAREQSVEVRGKRIRFLEMGDGPPIVLLHSFPTSSYEWRHVIPLLARRYRVCAPDFVGYGKSTAEPSTDRSLAAQAPLIAEWMDHIGIESAIIVGQDIGGGVAQILAVKYPRRVKGLVLVNSVCFESWPSDYAELLAEPGWGRFTSNFFGARPGLKGYLKRGVYQQALLSRGVVDNYAAPWQGAEGKRNLIRAAEALDPRDVRRVEGALRKIRVPTLVIAGRFDPIQSPNYSRRLAGAIPRSQFLSIPECGHFASEDEPEKLVRYIFDYFKN